MAYLQRLLTILLIFFVCLNIAPPAKAQTCTKKSQGDANCDNNVDLSDFKEFRDELILFQQGKLTIQQAAANFNGDTSIDLLDFAAFRVGYIASLKLTPTPTVTVKATLTPTVKPTVTLTPLITPTATIPSMSICTPPYTSNGPWNTPVTNPVYEANSATYASGIGTIGSNVSSFTMPVYEADSKTPIKTATVSGVFSKVVDNTSIVKSKGTFQVPIPARAAPASGSDAQIVIWNKETGEEWGFWQVSMTSSGLSAVNGYYYKTSWSGVPPSGFGSRGAGVPYLTGLIRPCEIRQGHIDHAIAFAYEKVSSQFVYPATKSDGSGSGVPEGARILLDPTIPEATIKSWGCNGTCLIIAKALQKYGMIAIDYAGHSKIYGEYQGSANWGSTEWNDKIINSIPMNQFKVVKFR
jgi:hypothetical protein